MFFVLLLRRAPKWFTALECDECGGGGRRIGTGKRKGEEGKVRLGTGFVWVFVGFGFVEQTAKKGSRREAEELSTFYLLSTANNVMCRRAIVCKRGRGRDVACPKLTCGVCATSC